MEAIATERLSRRTVRVTSQQARWTRAPEPRRRDHVRSRTTTPCSSRSCSRPARVTSRRRPSRSDGLNATRRHRVEVSAQVAVEARDQSVARRCRRSPTDPGNTRTSNTPRPSTRTISATAGSASSLPTITNRPAENSTPDAPLRTLGTAFFAQTTHDCWTART
jgi:hypothetical protein